MTQLFKGMIIGSAITAAAMAGYAFGDANDQRQQEVVEGSELARCDVRVGFGRYTSGDQCRFDQVMVGARDGYLLCADVQVTCPNQ